MSTREIKRSDEHYAPIAAAYITSPIHAQGQDLGRMVELAGLSAGDLLLDVGAGTGHTALAFARHGVRAVGLDLTQAMLRQAVGLAAERELDFAPVQGLAESLPFADRAFDAVACRYCAHHFMDTRAAIIEMGRVARPGGLLVFVDHVAPEDDVADEFVNRLDWLRDPSHRREARLSEYHAWLAEAGFEVERLEHFQETMVADPWFARARTEPAREAEARAMLQAASPELRALFTIQESPLQFNLHMVLLVARRRG
jgi:ubiquinone/menaquinone biosynthesis C-methylase UbiE